MCPASARILPGIMPGRILLRFCTPLVAIFIAPGPAAHRCPHACSVLALARDKRAHAVQLFSARVCAPQADAPLLFFFRLTRAAPHATLGQLHLAAATSAGRHPRGTIDAALCACRCQHIAEFEYLLRHDYLSGQITPPYARSRLPLRNTLRFLLRTPSSAIANTRARRDLVVRQLLRPPPSVVVSRVSASSLARIDQAHCNCVSLSLCCARPCVSTIVSLCFLYI